MEETIRNYCGSSSKVKHNEKNAYGISFKFSSNFERHFFVTVYNKDEKIFSALKILFQQYSTMHFFFN